MTVLTRRVGAAVCVWSCLAALPGAQTPRARDRVRDAESFRAVMRESGVDLTIVQEAAAAPTYLLNSVRGDSLGRIEAMQRSFESVRTFLGSRGRHDAAMQVDELLDVLAAMRMTLARAEPDQTEAGEIVAAVVGACQACHARYREGDERSGYRARAGVLD